MATVEYGAKYSSSSHVTICPFRRAYCALLRQRANPKMRCGVFAYKNLRVDFYLAPQRRRRIIQYCASCALTQLPRQLLLLLMLLPYKG